MGQATLETQRRYKAQKRELGLCLLCRTEAAPGASYCQRHLDQRDARKVREREDRERNFIEPVSEPDDRVTERLHELLLDCKARGLTFADAWQQSAPCAVSHAREKDRRGWVSALRATMSTWRDIYYGMNKTQPLRISAGMYADSSEERRDYTLVA